MKVKVDFDYWNTLYEYLNKDEFKLNGDIIHDARIIKRVQCLWQNASEEYLRNIEVKYLAQVYTNIDELTKLTTYKNTYETFVSYLFYATDRMNLNRWLYLQMCMNRTFGFVYNEYNNNDDNDWTKKICDGFYEGREYFYNIEESCEKEWIGIILPLIKQAQRNED